MAPTRGRNLPPGSLPFPSRGPRPAALTEEYCGPGPQEEAAAETVTKTLRCFPEARAGLTLSGARPLLPKANRRRKPAPRSPARAPRGLLAAGWSDSVGREQKGRSLSHGKVTRTRGPNQQPRGPGAASHLMLEAFRWSVLSSKSFSCPWSKNSLTHFKNVQKSLFINI